MTKRPAKLKVPAAQPGAAVDPGGFSLGLDCPQCGAPFVVTDETVSHVCGHCRSLLIVLAPDREEVFAEPAQVSDPKDILETLIRYRLDAHRASLIARLSDREGRPPSDLMVAPLLSLFESRLRGVARLVEVVPVRVPYQHTSGKIVQATLGRHGDGAKIARVRAYTAEQTLPAYDATQFNLRDSGLRLGRSVFRPLLSADVPSMGRFLPRSVAGESRRGLDKWRTQNLEAGFDAVAKHGRVVVNFEAIVYRPYFVVRAVLEKGEESLLFDGGFGTIAGYLDEAERRKLARLRASDPLGASGPSFRRVTVASARCPNCGVDPRLPQEALLSVCGNCHAGVSPGRSGLVLANYDREEGLTSSKDLMFLPFWRFPFSVTIGNAKAMTTLEDYAAALFPQGIPNGFRARGDTIMVPAWRLMTTAAGDDAFAVLTRDLHAIAWQWTEDRVGLEARAHFTPVTLPQGEARDLAWASLFGIHTKASAARLNTLLLKRFLFDAHIAFGEGSVAYIAFRRSANAFERPEARVPRLLVEGGPTLAAQRVSVQAASSAFLSAQKRPSMADRVRTSRFSSESE